MEKRRKKNQNNNVREKKSGTSKENKPPKEIAVQRDRGKGCKQENGGTVFAWGKGRSTPDRDETEQEE